MRKRRVLISVVILASLAGAIVAVNLSRLSIRFEGGPSISFSPLQYANNITVFPKENVTINQNKIMSASVTGTSATVTVSSTPYGTSTMFQTLTFTIYFNSTQLNLNGLQNQTLTLNLGRGYYVISISLSYTSLSTVADSNSASWQIAMTGK